MGQYEPEGWMLFCLGNVTCLLDVAPSNPLPHHYHLHPFHFVGSYLSELQLSEHVSYLNVFSKATHTISGYFWQWKAGRSCSNGWYQGFQCSLYPLYGSWKHRITSKVGFSGKVKATVKVSRWVTASLLHAPTGNGNQATTYGCVHYSAC